MNKTAIEILLVIMFFVAAIGIAHAEQHPDINLGTCYTQKVLNEREQSAYQMGVRNGQAMAQGTFVKNMAELCKQEGAIEIFDGYVLACFAKENLNGAD